MTSVGYRRGYVSFAHFLLYFIFISFNTYRKDINFKGPMELLDLSQVEDIGDESYPVFEGKLYLSLSMAMAG